MPRVENATPEPVELPDWGDFKVQMFSDAAYQRVSKASDTQTVARIETFFAVQGSEYPMVVQLWQGMLFYCPEAKRPTAGEAAIWGEIASANSMPFEFDELGQLKIKES